jgi:hypothetical protein
MRPDQELQPRPKGAPGKRPSDDADEFWSGIGLDVEAMSPRAQVAAGLAVAIPVALGAVAVLTLIPQFFWLIFVFGWTIFPAFGLLVRGIAGLSEDGGGGKGRLGGTASSGERELLLALAEHGEITPARAAMETSLSVSEADRMLRGLAEAGHLEVRVRGGGLFYALWGTDDQRAVNSVEGRT